MPYVGNPLADAYSARQKQDLTGQSGTTFTLTHAVSSPNDLSVYINHVRQEPTTAYTVYGTALTTTGSVAGTDDFYIIYDELALQSISHPANQAMTATSGTFTSGLVGTTGTFSGAVSGTNGTFSGNVSGTLTTAAQPNVTSVGTLTGLTTAGATISTGNPQLFLASTGDGGEGSINFKDDEGNVDGKIAYRTDYAGNPDNYLTINTAGTEKFRIDSDGNTKIRNANATGPVLDIGTTSTSVADDGVMGGIDFTSGSSSTVNARLYAKQYGTTENAGYFSNELRAPNGNSLGEVSREFITQNAHGGIYIKRPMPANIFYYREIYKSVNLSASQSGTTFLTLNQNDYFCSIACFVDFWTLDTNYPTSAFLRRFGLTANTHQGRSSWGARFTSITDMGEYNTGTSEVSSASANMNLSIHTTKSAGSNNGHLYIRYHTGSYTEASATMRIYGMFLNIRFDNQDITANL